ncbi:MAG: hypothetical protein QOC92_2558 [Acidimicrobiaceae bacterium]|jgi:uncharacterized protein (TIGR03083 family)
MTLPREEVVAGFTDELSRFEELIRSVSADDWRTPTRCEGWTAQDVASHVTGQLSDIVNGRFEGLGTPEVTQRQVDERRSKTPDELADELAEASKVGADILGSFDDAAWSGPPPLDIPGTLGEGVEGLWFDAWVHGDDIRAALGRTSEPGPGVRASVSHLADLLSHREWGPATIAVKGLEEFPVSGGGGQRVEGDPIDFVLVACGRKDSSTLGLDPTVNVYA